MASCALSSIATRVLLVIAVLLAGAQAPALADEGEGLPPGQIDTSPVTPEDDLDSDGDGVADRPDTVTAAQTAHQLGERVEDLSQRTTTVQVFANADGTWTTEASAGPVRAQDPETGEWSPIDTGLAHDGSRWAPESTLGQMTFSDGGYGPLVVMKDVDGKDLSWSWPDALPVPTVEGSTLTYHNVVSHGDLVVEAQAGGFSHSVVLRQAPSEPLELPMLVDTDGATMSTDQDGSLSIETSQGELVSAPEPAMWDTSEDVNGEPTTVAVDTAVRDAGDQTRVVLNPDQDFLTDPSTVYPVTIDPTYSVALSENYYAVFEDPKIERDGRPDDYLRVGNDGWNKSRVLINFPAAQLRVGDITSATLKLYALESDSCNAMSIKVQRVTSSWYQFTDWSEQPSVATAGTSTATQVAKGGPGSCSAQGWDTWDITSIAQAWGAGTDNYGLELAAVDEDSTAWRNYSVSPVITVTSNGAPGTPAAPMPSDSRTWQASYHTRTATPAWSTSAFDPDGALLRYTVEVHATATGTSTVLASCVTGYVASQTESSCTPSTPLANGTYFVRAAADDGTLTGSWSPWRQVTVNYDQPEPATVSCPGTANNRWYATRPASTMNCTFTSPGAVQLEWTLNGVSQTALTANSSGAATKSSIAIPASGWTTLKVRGVSNSGMASGWTEYAFGTGSPQLIAPTSGASSATTFQVRGVGPTGMDSAVVQWRTGSSDTWKTATQTFTDSGAAWDGTVTDSGYMSSTPTLTWRPAAEAGMAIPASIQVRVEFLDGTTVHDTQTNTVTVAAHAAGNAAPTADVGAGAVQLGSGEFQTSAVDVSIGSMAIARSHLSNAEAATGASGVFGWGWAASIGAGGPSTFEVTDQRSTNASLLFATPNGTVYTYQSTSPAASNLTGDFAAVGDAKTLDATVTISATTGVLSFTEFSGTVTTFEKTSGSWKPTSTFGTGNESTTSYYYDSTGLPTWVIAPAPTGVTCTPTALPAGCQALHITYTTVNSAKRVASIDYHAWDPALTDTDGDNGNDGLPDTNAGVTTTTVAKYSYNTNGTLQAVWDPRVADGTSALKTTYTYTIAGTKTRLASITPPGLKTWTINYDTDGAVTTITRAHDSAVGTGNATWTVKYGLKLNAEGDGLPNLSAAKTAAWGQPAADAPVTGAAVFGPDRVPASTPTSTDWTYSTLYYWNAKGRQTNSATYSSGWQIGTIRYDSVGNTIWALTPTAKAQAIADGAGDAATSAAAADRYASWTLYNSDGDRVEAEYGPIIEAVTDDGTTRNVRSLTQYVYDEEADASLVPGRPTTDVPADGYGLVAEVRSSATDEATPGTWAIASDTPTTSTIHLYDTVRFRYRYDPAVTGDPSGWTLLQPTAALAQNGASWDKTVYRYDTSGRLIEERTPQGVATSQQTSWHDTIHYTADNTATRSECRNNPAWAGLVCWEGPAAQPSTGQAIPTTSYTGYSLDQSATRVVSTGGSATKVETAQYDAAGRPTRAATTTTGTSDQTVPATTTSYSTTTGLQVSVSNGTMTMTTGYDTWGRTTSQTDGAGNTATTAYNAAARVATISDGKGTYTYGYGTTGAFYGQSEHRGMATSLDTGISGTTLYASYDADGTLAAQQFPLSSGGGTNRASWTYDLAGNLRDHRFTETAGVHSVYWQATSKVSVAGRVRVATEPGRTQTYYYDDRGRLTKVNDQTAGGTDAGCLTRQYTFTADSNRTSLASYSPASGGGCQTSTGTTTSSSFDEADRITNTGYAYDEFGRTTTVPAAHTTTTGSGNATATYYANDMVATLAQGTDSQTYTLDPVGRISTTTNLTNGVALIESTNHYVDGSDSPAWTETKTRPNASAAWTTTWTRYVRGLDGNLAITQTSTGTAQVALYNTHGDLAATADLGSISANSNTYYTEYGLTRDGTPNTSRYGWLGVHQRDTQGIGGLTLMGARLYNPTTGRFLSRDPILGGGDNSYSYPADPINQMDVSGEIWTSVSWSAPPFAIGSCTRFGVAAALFGCGFTGTKGRLWNAVLSIHVTPRDQAKYTAFQTFASVVAGLAGVFLATRVPLPGRNLGVFTDRVKFALASLLLASWGVYLYLANGRDIIVNLSWTYRVTGDNYLMGKKYYSYSHAWPFGFTPFVWMRYSS